MLETVWYLLILALQVLQVDPSLKPDKFQVDVFVGSAPAYSFSVRGDAVQGQVMDAEAKAVFGEFESTRRLPQAYVVFPRAALRAEVEQAMNASKDSGTDSAGGSSASGASASAKGATAGGTAATEEKPQDLYPFTIDFTKTLAQLASFKTQPRQVIVFTEAARFLDSGSKDGKDAASAKASASPAPSASPKASASPSAAAGAKPSASPAASSDPKAEEEAKIEIRRYANRLVLTAGFVQTVIIVNFMP